MTILNKVIDALCRATSEPAEAAKPTPWYVYCSDSRSTKKWYAARDWPDGRREFAPYNGGEPMQRFNTDWNAQAWCDRHNGVQETQADRDWLENNT